MQADKTPSSIPSEHADSAVQFPRTIRSFVTRAGRTTPSQQKAIDNLSQAFVLPYQDKPIDWRSIFSRQAPRILEIGFGMGDATAYIAGLMPETDFIGVEVHEPGIGALLKKIDEQKLNNLRLIQHDAVDVIKQMLEPQSLDGIHIFFPDPWHKKRHHKRRLIQTEFIHLLSSRLKQNGYIHCATDWEHYAEQMLTVLSAEPSLSNTANNYAERPGYRPITKFENRGLRLGHGVWDLVFRKI